MTPIKPMSTSWHLTVFFYINYLNQCSWCRDGMGIRSPGPYVAIFRMLLRLICLMTLQKSWYHLQRKVIGEELAVVCFCSSSSKCVHKRFIEEYGEEQFPSDDVLNHGTFSFCSLFHLVLMQRYKIMTMLYFSLAKLGKTVKNSSITSRFVSKGKHQPKAGSSYFIMDPTLVPGSGLARRTTAQAVDMSPWHSTMYRSC
jgi:hypothetical protein